MMHEIVEQIQKLKQELRSLRSQIHDRVLEVAKRYIVAEHPTNRGYGYPTVAEADFRWTIESNQVRVQWDESWAYGGQDQGAFFFPVNYIWDDAALVAYEESRVETKETKQRKARERKREEELRQLETLKEKYSEVSRDE